MYQWLCAVFVKTRALAYKWVFKLRGMPPKLLMGEDFLAPRVEGCLHAAPSSAPPTGAYACPGSQSRLPTSGVTAGRPS